MIIRFEDKVERVKLLRDKRTRGMLTDAERVELERVEGRQREAAGERTVLFAIA